MKKRELVISIAFATLFVCFFGFISSAKANYMEVLNTIGGTARTINAVNSAARGTMSTVEYSQRFTDRQQERKDYKRAEKEYNEKAQEEYYKTIQETQALQQRYYYDNSDL